MVVVNTREGRQLAKSEGLFPLVRHLLPNGAFSDAGPNTNANFRLSHKAPPQSE
jgi:hypothetical protein